MRKILSVFIIAIFVLLSERNPVMSSEIDMEAERATIKETIHNSIGWAANKDVDLLYSCFAKDSNLFYFNPDASSIIGFDNFKKLTETVFMDDAFKAIRYEIRELRINISNSGDVAWYSSKLDDENEWNGQPASWINVRWTGILEKREGHWVIVQMHFSYASNGEDDSETKTAGEENK